MITQHNYFSSIEKIGLDKLPLPMQKTHDFIVRDTQNGSNWERSLASEAIKRTIELQLNALSSLLAKQEKEAPVMKVEKKEKDPKAEKQKKEVPKEPCKCKKDKPKKAAATPKQKPVQEYQEPVGLKVGHYPEEIRILRKVAGWEGKQVERKPFLALVRSMEKAIAERKIRKSSKNGKIITALQKNFEKGVVLLNSEGATGVKINFNGQLGADIREAATSQVLFNSVPLLKRAINMMGDKPDKAKVERLNKAILSAVATKKVGKKDIYRSELNAVQKSLEQYLKGETSTLKLHHVPLSGLADVVGNVGK